MPSQIFLPFISVQKPQVNLDALLLARWMNDPHQLRPKMEADDCLMRYAKWKAEDIIEHRLSLGHRASNGEMPNDTLRRMGCPIPSWYSEGNPNDDLTGNNVESLGYGYSTLDDLFAAFWSSPKHQAHVYATDSFWLPHVKMGVCHYENPHPGKDQWPRVYVLVSTPEA